jgi:DNA mismatch repair ATPase MutS
MSITGAVEELNKEIERLTKLRDALRQGSLEGAVARAAAGRRSGSAKKSAAVKKSSQSVPTEKRTLSSAGRKRMSDAAKARWAARKKAAPAK